MAKRPRVIAFEVTRKCRLNCLHCRAAATQSDKREFLSTQQCKSIIDSFSQDRQCVLVFTGGEAMEREDIYDLIDYANTLGHRVSLAASGYLLNDESLKKLKQLDILTISFSLDGKDAASHDSFRGVPGIFDIAVEAMKKCREYGIRFQVNTAVTSRNKGQILDIGQLAKELGAYCINPFIFIPTGRGSAIAKEAISPSDYEKLLVELAKINKSGDFNVRINCGPQFNVILARDGRKLLASAGKRNGCPGGSDYAFINYKGNVQTCGFLNVSAGNLLENGYDFNAIWNESPLLKQVRDRSLYQGVCKTCDQLSICGGCRARAYEMTGSFLESDPVCFYDHSYFT